MAPWSTRLIRRRPSAVQTRTLSLESWIYPVSDLGPVLRQFIEKEDPRPEIILVFAVDPRHTYLLEGEKYLEMAARAAVHEEGSAGEGR